MENSEKKISNWEKTRCRKIDRRRRRLNKGRRKKAARHKQTPLVQPQHDKKRRAHEQRMVAPKHLSILENANETLHYFNSVYSVFLNCKKGGDRVYFDLSGVEYITVDAVMYLIALVNNVKRVSAFNIPCAGNVPDNAEARNVITRVGFYQHVSSVHTRAEMMDDKQVKITKGKDANGLLSSQVVDFVRRTGGSHMEGTKRLYPMLIELMTNTAQHAYNEKSIMAKNWYVFAENEGSRIRVVFLDTGEGIPSTIRKNFFEVLKSKIIDSDAQFIASALRGEFRSETKESHRGRGLPEIRTDVEEAMIAEMQIISGRGHCKLTPGNEIETTALKEDLKGTLFSWCFQ